VLYRIIKYKQNIVKHDSVNDFIKLYSYTVNFNNVRIKLNKINELCLTIFCLHFITNSLSNDCRSDALKLCHRTQK